MQHHHWVPQRKCAVGINCLSLSSTSSRLQAAVPLHGSSLMPVGVRGIVPCVQNGSDVSQRDRRPDVLPYRQNAEQKEVAFRGDAHFYSFRPRECKARVHFML